jgi:hypothetical protein
MKQIILKSAVETVKDSKGIEHSMNVCTQDLITVALETPPKDGFTLKDFRKRDRIETAMQKVKIFDGGDDSYDCIDLEDSDYSYLKEIVNYVKWTRRSAFLMAFLEQFEA